MLPADPATWGRVATDPECWGRVAETLQPGDVIRWSCCNGSRDVTGDVSRDVLRIMERGRVKKPLYRRNTFLHKKI